MSTVGSAPDGTIERPAPIKDTERRRPWWWWDRPPRWWWVLAALVVLIVIAVIGDAVINYPPLGSGDPGGATLHQLALIKTTLPRGSVAFYETPQEPGWIGSCTDEYFTRGWGFVGYSFEFGTGLSQREVLSRITTRMSALGWGRRYDVPGGSWGWKTTLPTGRQGEAGLSPPFRGNPNWGMSANAKPAPPVGRCAGP